MSCRAMGRGVEIAVINWLKDFYIGQLGYSSITSKYIPTKKNLPVKDLFTQQKFLIRHRTENEYIYELSSERVTQEKCDWINFTSKV
jgi:predicted enzyme involved in methoxymalonyl-ACP biosynthesis